MSHMLLDESHQKRPDAWDDQDSRYIHLKEISVNFIKRRPNSDLELVFKDDTGVKHKSNKFSKDNLILWNVDMYIRAHSRAKITIRRAFVKIVIADILVVFELDEFLDDSAVELEDTNHNITVNLVCGRSQSLEDVACVLPRLPRVDFQAGPDLASTVPRFLERPWKAALPSPTSERGYNVPYPAIYWLNDDILLNIFNCYRLYGDGLWNIRLGWCKLSHVCQRWRHLMFESAFHLDMYIECASGTPILNTLDHIPPLPLFINYKNPITKEDEKGIYYALGLHDRVRHIHLDLSSSILHKVLVLLDEYFPLLEHLSLSFAAENSIPIAFPKAFLAPSLRHLALPGINPPKRLRLLTFAVSLVILHLSNIETSSYFRPRLLVARLRSLPQLAELSISFSTPIPRPSAEMELLGEQGTPVTLPNLQTLQFKGVSAYLESVIAQIRVPLLKWFVITLFNQIAFALPHLSRFINRIEGSQLPALRIHFDPNEVSIVTACHHDGSPWFDSAPLFLRVMCNCKQLDWQIDCATQICNALGPAIIGVERFTLDCYYLEIPTAFQNGTIDSTTWHELLRSFIGVKELHVADALLEEFSRALQEDDIGSHPGILPNLQYIRAADNLFTVFIDARQAVGRPVQFLRLY